MNKHTTWDPGGRAIFNETNEEEPLVFGHTFNETGKVLAARHNAMEEKGREMGFQVITTCIIGSQNYKLDTKDSDFDTCSIVLPNWEHYVIDGDIPTHTYIFDDGESTIRSCHSFVNCLYKLGHTTIEPLYTNLFVVNPKFAPLWNILRENRTKILYGHPNSFFKSSFGFGQSMYKRMLNKKDEKYRADLGYCPKAFSHYIRNLAMIRMYCAHFEDIYHTAFEKWLQMVKQGEKMNFSGNLIAMLADQYDKWEQQTQKMNWLDDPEVDTLLRQWLLECGRIMVENYNGEDIIA